ncbi:MAG: OsmC family protein [Actinomycetota bacterium]
MTDLPITVTWSDGDRFDIRIRDHTLIVDQPAHDGGTDSGPTPTEMFVASLAACTAFYAGRFLRRHNLTVDGLRIESGWTMSDDRPHRVETIAIDVITSTPLDGKQIDKLRAVVERCTVQNTLNTPPRVSIKLGGTTSS